MPLTRMARWSWAALRTAPRQSWSLAQLQIQKELFNVLHPRVAWRGSTGGGHAVRLIGLRITDICNLRCHTCGQWGPRGYLRDVPLRELRRLELPVMAYHTLIDDVVRAGWRPVWYIWGGEPLLYPHIEGVLRHIAELKMPISLVTNGTNLERYAELLAETCAIVHVSIDGASARVHNAARPGMSATYDSFAHCLKGIRALNAARRDGRVFPLLAPITCINAHNSGELPGIHALLREEADVHVFYFTWWIDAEALDEHAAEFARRFHVPAHTATGWWRERVRLDADTVAAGVAALRDTAAAASGSVPMFFPPLEAADDIRAYYTNHREAFGYDQCVSIYMTMEVNPNGDVSLCRDYHDYVIGNITTDGMHDMWNGSRARAFRSSITNQGLLPVCRRCCGLMGF